MTDERGQKIRALERRSVPAKLRAFWHILRGRRVVYGVAISGGQWRDQGWEATLVFVDCRFRAGFLVNGSPAVEHRDRFGDVHVKPLPRTGDGPEPAP